MEDKTETQVVEQNAVTESVAAETPKRKTRTRKAAEKTDSGRKDWYDPWRRAVSDKRGGETWNSASSYVGRSHGSPE